MIKEMPKDNVQTRSEDIGGGSDTKKKRLKLKAPSKSVMLVLLVISIIFVGICFSGMISRTPVHGSILRDGTKVIKKLEGQTRTFRIEGDHVKMTDLLLGRRYTVEISEEYLDHKYEVKYTIPRFFSQTEKIEGCSIVDLEYRRILGVIHIFKSAEFVASCDYSPNTVDYEKIQEDLISKILTVEEKSPTDKFAITIRCEGDDCEYMDTMEEPYSWYRFAQYLADVDSGDFKAEKYLEDMNRLDPIDFDWRVFQYGEITTHDDATIEKYGDSYLNVVHTVYPEDMFKIDMGSDEIDVWTTDNQMDVDQANNYREFFEGNTLHGAVNKSSADVMAFAAAYQITGDEKYLGVANYMLWQGHVMNYVQDDVQSPLDIEFKASTCNLALAETVLYEATEDPKYLEYVNYIVDKGVVKKIYSDVAVNDTDKGTYTPMNYVPCMVAMEKMGRLFPESKEKYYEVADTMYEYLIDNHLIELAEGTEGYPLLVGMDHVLMNVFKYYDITASCWLLDSLTMKNNRNE